MADRILQAKATFIWCRKRSLAQGTFHMLCTHTYYFNIILHISLTISFLPLSLFHNSYSNHLNKQQQYKVLSRVRELGLLEKTAELGILSKLEKNGLTLEKAEQLLPTLEELGLLSLVANNQQLLINGVAPLAVEGAPILLPVVAGALEVGPPAFFLAAAGAAGLDAYLFASGAEVPFIGLSAGAVAGLLLVPLSVVSAGVGVALGSLKN